MPYLPCVTCVAMSRRFLDQRYCYSPGSLYQNCKANNVGLCNVTMLSFIPLVLFQLHMRSIPNAIVLGEAGLYVSWISLWVEGISFFSWPLLLTTSDICLHKLPSYHNVSCFILVCNPKTIIILIHVFKFLTSTDFWLLTCWYMKGCLAE